MEEYLSIDKQICSTKGRIHLKRYVLSKPHKWVYELFVLRGASGYAYSFEILIDSGQENDSSRRCDDEPDLGAVANHVVRLVRAVPKHSNLITIIQQ